MKKVVINTCFGGFSLSKAATKRMAELQGRECYFFTHSYAPGADHDKYVPIPYPSPEDERESLFWLAFDIPNPNEVLAQPKNWHALSMKEKQAHNDLWGQHNITNRPDDREDPLLIQVVEELGEAANGACAELKVVEIPSSTQYTIEEYDGREHIAEVHRTWA